MDNKRSKGVTIFAILIFIGGVLNLLSDLYFEFNTAPIWRIIICTFIHSAQIFCGIGILVLKEFVRRITIYVYSFLIFWIPFLIILYYQKQYATYLNSIPQEIPLGIGEFIIKALFVMTIILSIIWFIAVLYFFTRPKVKTQFK